VPTARVTIVFLSTEMLVIGLFCALGIAKLLTHGAVVAPSLHWFVPTAGTDFARLVTVAIVGFTIVDGWELDSHAAEEAKQRRLNPGTGGLIGLLIVTALYLIAFFLLFSLAPLQGLVDHQTNVLAYLATLVAPAWATQIMIIGILASTASGLWLTHFILNRALYAMSRDGVIPVTLGRIHPRFRTPWLLVLLTTVAEVAVTTILVNVPNVASFFTIVLQTAGLFLSAVFVLANLSALVYFRAVIRESLHHLILLGLFPLLAVLSMSGLIIGYMVQQSGVTLIVIGALVALTVPFVLQASLRRSAVISVRRGRAYGYHHPDDAEALANAS
jgi:amino acid transporter